MKQLELVNALNNDPFVDIIYSFTSQRSNLFVSGIRDSIENTEYTEYQDTPFWKLHPEARFVFKSLFMGFKKNLPLSPLELAEKAEKIKQDINERLLLDLLGPTYGIDIDLITALSGEVYESKAAQQLRLAILPTCSCPALNRPSALKLDEPIEFKLSNIHAIRKQLNLALNSTLVLGYDGTIFKAIGITSPEDKDAYPFFLFEKNLSWSFNLPTKATSKSKQGKFRCIVRYQQGNLMFPVVDLTKEIKALLKRVLPQEKYIVRNAAKMINTINKCKHGAVLIISDPDTINGEVARLAKAGNRGTYFVEPRNILVKDNAKMIEQLAEIDGAILVDFEGNSPACGVILDGLFNADTNPPGEECSKGLFCTHTCQCTPGNRGRGARYNSTRLYIDMFKTRSAYIVGVIKSEDGMLDIISPLAMQ